jgi:hypothetical protein
MQRNGCIAETGRIMKLPKAIRRLFKMKGGTRRRGQEEARAEIAGRIEARGYQLLDVSGLHNGKIAARRYILIDPEGNTLDNGGNGFACSADALKSIIDVPRK